MISSLADCPQRSGSPGAYLLSALTSRTQTVFSSGLVRRGRPTPRYGAGGARVSL
jgi:hypothetical protein